ncbi:NAD-dependent protein deacylase [Enterococcus sp. LJL99]
MKQIESAKAVALIQAAESLTFLTGAGISTPSGVPDYRSLTGIYQGIERPEYLLSDTCMRREPEKFYEFVKKLYHPAAKPNAIHQAIAGLEKKKSIWTISQNIDGLHEKAGSHQLVDFHGSLYHCHCLKCGKPITWEDYLQSDEHATCGGQIRPDITLYEEALSEKVIEQAIRAVSNTELLVIVGTSFQVHPFCDLIHYASETTTILVINQTPLHIERPYYFLKENALTTFKNIKIEEQ